MTEKNKPDQDNLDQANIDQANVKQAENNKISAWKMLLVVIGMFGFGFALVPLYDVICDITGLNGKTGVIDASELAKSEADVSREIDVSFITSINESAPLELKGEVAQLKVHPGKSYTVNFIAKNTSDKVIIAQAIPSVTPRDASMHFDKVQCFCFEEQELQPGQEVIMPVEFIVKNELPKKVTSIILSYTYFDNS